MDNKNKTIKKKAEEKEIKEWLEGTWEWSGYIYGNWTWSRLQIQDGFAVAYSPNGILDQGPIRIDMNDQMFYFGKYSYVIFRHNGVCQDVLYFDKKPEIAFAKHLVLANIPNKSNVKSRKKGQISLASDIKTSS